MWVPLNSVEPIPKGSKPIYTLFSEPQNYIHIYNIYIHTYSYLELQWVEPVGIALKAKKAYVSSTTCLSLWLAVRVLQDYMMMMLSITNEQCTK